MTPDQLQEARRLHLAGYKLCELHPNSKRPVGDGWNNKPITGVTEAAGGYGLMLALNGLCSVDVDDEFLTELGLENVGFNLEEIRHAGVHTSSTRPGSGGRVTFRVPAGVQLEWVKFSSKTFGTVLELRATSPNLQDTLPGTVYHSQDGTGPWRQFYANGRVMEDAPELPEALLAWWARMSKDVDYKQAQQRLFIGHTAQVAISSSDGRLGYGSTHRAEFNRGTSVADILVRHGYEQHKNKRWSPSTATGAPAVREIPGKQDLWQSDHASDPLFGMFDAWTAHVVLDHDHDLPAAEAAFRARRAHEAIDGFEDEEVTYTPLALPAPAEEFDFGDEPSGSGGALSNGLSGGPLALPDDLPAFSRDNTGAIKPIVGNLIKALSREDIAGWRIGYDEFRAEIMLAPPGTDQWRPFGDADFVWLCDHLETGMNGFAPIAKERIRDVVLAVADRNKFDSAKLWLNGLPDDGGSRCETFLIDYYHLQDTPYHRAVSLYLWTALAGRVLDPGCQADMALVLVGGQGLRKSTSITAMLPAKDFFVKIALNARDDDLARKMRGKLLGEIAELRGLHTKELEAIKDFITQTDEEWIPKYREFSAKFPRRLVFIGTTNKDQFLADDTGERRWLPLQVGQEINVRGIRRVAMQCWAEARRLWQAGGVAWEAAQTLATVEHEKFTFSDPWTEVIAKWLRLEDFDQILPTSKGFVTTSEVLVDALKFDPKAVKRADEMRVSSVLKKLGFFSKKMWHEGRTVNAFLPTLPTSESEVGR